MCVAPAGTRILRTLDIKTRLIVGRRDEKMDQISLYHCDNVKTDDE